MAEKIQQKELATRLGLTTRQIHNLDEQNVFTKDVKNGRATYPWPASLKAYIAFKVESEAKKTAPANLELARARKMEADAKLAEIAVLEAEGRLIPVEIHEERVTALAERLAGRCKGLGRYVGDVQRALTAIEASTLLDRISDELLRTLQASADDDDDASDSDDDTGD